MKPINVKDVCDPMQTLSVIVYADEPLEDVLRRFSEESWMRGIFRHQSGWAADGGDHP